MKKLMVLVGLVLIGILCYLSYYGGLTNFEWDSSYDAKIYSKFLGGSYHCPEDIDPGSYEVEFRGRATKDFFFTVVSTVTIFGPDIGSYSEWISKGAKGFRFKISAGQKLSVSPEVLSEMRIKKVT